MVEKKMRDFATDLAVEVDGRPWTKELAYLYKRPSYPAISGGLLSQRAESREPNIPKAFGGLREWRLGALIQTLPSVIQTGPGAEGPSRTMLPQTSLGDIGPLSERERLTFSRPATPSEAWRPGYRLDEDAIALDEGEKEILARRRQVGPLAPPIAAQAVVATQAAPPFTMQGLGIRRDIRRRLGLEE